MTLEELRAVVEAMTPGPWEARCHEGLVALVSPQGWLLEADPPVGNDEQDALAIAALRNVAPELLAVVEAVWKDLEGDGSREAIIDAMRDVAEKLVSL